MQEIHDQKAGLPGICAGPMLCGHDFYATNTFEVAADGLGGRHIGMLTAGTAVADAKRRSARSPVGGNPSLSQD